MRQHFAVDEVTTLICRQLAKLAKKGFLEKENEYGIVVDYHKRDIGVIRFTFVTEDEIECSMTIDLKTMNRDQMLQMAHDLKEGIYIKREQRRKESLPTIITSSDYTLDKQGTLTKKPLANAVHQAMISTRIH